MMQNKLLISKKSPKGEDGYSTFSIRIQNDLLEKIETITKQTGRSRNELIGILLEYATQNCEVIQEKS